MKHSKRTFGRRLLAGVSAGALGLLGAAGVAATALADDPGNIDPGAESSLTIHKYLGLHSDDFGPNNGTELKDDDIPNLPVASGVEFIVKQVGVVDDEDNCVALDVTKTEDWPLVEGAYNTTPATWGTGEGEYCFVPGFGTSGKMSASTSNGEVTFDLGLGFYYVTEGADSGNNNIVQKAEPFFVTVPYPSYAANGTVEHTWTYNVHVYPKNQKADKPTKTISTDPSALTIGSTVTWTITAIIPNTADDITEASIYDQLDSRLKYKSSTVKVDGTAVVAGDVTPPTADQAGGTVKWTFTNPQGLAKINANKGKTITVEFVTEVVSVGDGTIQNAPGDLGNGYGSSFNEVPTPGENTPGTAWGQLSILKTDKGTPAKNLQGAKFQVFERVWNEEDEEYEACAADWEDAGTAVATGTSDENGVVQWTGVNPTNPLGLWIANWQGTESDPAPAPADLAKDYCVYETEAPAGYNAVQGAKVVTITPGTLGENVFSWTAVNTQKEGPGLPLTGANGTLLLIVGGIGLVAVAGGAHLVTKRRQGQVA